MKMNNTVNEKCFQEENNVNVPEKVEITKKDIDRAWFRWVTRSQAGWNYETMQGLGYCCTMLPFLKKVYKDPKELQDMVRLHSQYYNTNVTTGGFVIGADMAVEAEQGYKAKDLIPGLKTGLMGPLAGVGDTFFSVTINTILGSIATYHTSCTIPGTVEQHTESYLKLADNPYVNIIGHAGTEEFPFDYEKVVPVLGEAGKIFEVNAHTFICRKKSIENCVAIARLCKKHGLKILVNSDAHSQYEVASCKKAFEMLKEIDFPEELIINTSEDRVNDYLKSLGIPYKEF